MLFIKCCVCCMNLLKGQDTILVLLFSYFPLGGEGWTRTNNQ